MNQFGFAHLPFALANRRNPFQSLAQPGAGRPVGITTPGSLPGSGVNAFLGADPQTQQRLQEMQANPFMSTMGTTVPQNTWTGNQFNIPGITPPPAPAPAPPPVAQKPQIDIPKEFIPPAPPGFVYDEKKRIYVADPAAQDWDAGE